MSVNLPGNVDNKTLLYAAQNVTSWPEVSQPASIVTEHCIKNWSTRQR